MGRGKFTGFLPPDRFTKKKKPGPVGTPAFELTMPMDSFGPFDAVSYHHYEVPPPIPMVIPDSAGVIFGIDMASDEGSRKVYFAKSSPEEEPFRWWKDKELAEPAAMSSARFGSGALLKWLRGAEFLHGETVYVFIETALHEKVAQMGFTPVNNNEADAFHQAVRYRQPYTHTVLVLATPIVWPLSLWLVDELAELGVAVYYIGDLKATLADASEAFRKIYAEASAAISESTIAYDSTSEALAHFYATVGKRYITTPGDIIGFLPSL